jgi:hypothetical protein
VLSVEVCDGGETTAPKRNGKTYLEPHLYLPGSEAGELSEVFALGRRREVGLGNSQSDENSQRVVCEIAINLLARNPPLPIAR